MTEDKNQPTIDEALVKNPTDAFQLMREALSAASDVQVEEQLSCIPATVKRRTLAHLMDTISESDEEDHIDIRESIQRYHDIASILSLDIEMARAVADQIVRTFSNGRYP